MRRNDREIKDIKEINGIIKRCRVCRLAMCDDGHPYLFLSTSVMMAAFFIFMPRLREEKLTLSKGIIA